jgi:hypothetical protein
VLRHAFNPQKHSICSAVAYRGDGRRSQLFFRIVPDSYTNEKLIINLLDEN